jgi:prepilin-type N-terminal cleavage/methylation domain-containing protein
MEMKIMTKSECRMTTEQGFTLIELLFVIAIIVTLAALAVSALSGIQEKARITQDMNNLRQIALATQTYLNDNDGAFFLPTGGTSPWMNSLHPKYLSNWKTFQSPSDKRASSEDNTTAPVSYGFNLVLRCSATRSRIRACLYCLRRRRAL